MCIIPVVIHIYPLRAVSKHCIFVLWLNSETSFMLGLGTKCKWAGSQCQQGQRRTTTRLAKHIKYCNLHKINNKSKYDSYTPPGKAQDGLNHLVLKRRGSVGSRFYSTGSKSSFLLQTMNGDILRHYPSLTLGLRTFISPTT